MPLMLHQLFRFMSRIVSQMQWWCLNVHHYSSRQIKKIWITTSQNKGMFQMGQFLWSKLSKDKVIKEKIFMIWQIKSHQSKILTCRIYLPSVRAVSKNSHLIRADNLVLLEMLVETSFLKVISYLVSQNKLCLKRMNLQS